jgi:hypothetical protein
MSPTQEIDMIEVIERLARLETEFKTLEHQHGGIQTKLDIMITRFDKYEAKWGGVLMVGSALFAIFLALKTELLKWLGGR